MDNCVRWYLCRGINPLLWCGFSQVTVIKRMCTFTVSNLKCAARTWSVFKNRENSWGKYFPLREVLSGTFLTHENRDIKF
jgi:hypothetical protein